MSESRPDKCSHCKNPSTVHLTQIIDGKMKKLSMCGDCPHAQQVEQSLDYDIVGKLSEKNKLPKPTIAGVDMKCPNCGFGQADFKELGRLGCSQCYDVFNTKLSPILGKIHQGTEHKGKVPGVELEEATEPVEPEITVSPKELSELKNRLQEHVQREEYEEAAEIRDRIIELEEMQ